MLSPAASKLGRFSSFAHSEQQPLLATGKEALPKSKIANFMQSVLYGLVNSILTIPCMFGYAAIIFSHPDFRQSLPVLSKIVLFSSVVHQVCFTLKSSLPFSIGQVQDAGLIFLSTMSTSMVNNMQPDATLEEKIATVLVALALGTALLGLVVFIIGKVQLAGLVSYLPMPVVGGYLAFIGFFCLLAGLGICASESISSALDLTKIFNTHDLLLCLPAIICGTALTIISHKLTHVAALPGALVAMPLCFYLIIWITGVTMEESRELGWMGKSGEPVLGYEVFKLYDFKLVDWSVIPAQIGTWAGMTVVVAFSSCLDVAAIEMDMGTNLDVNHELTTVGVSNVLSGLTGGFTGSYIFSQTIFTFRTQTNSRVVGWVVALSELGLFMWSGSILAYLPNFFFAAALIFIAVDLMYEWLYLVYYRVTWREYAVLWVSFLVINFMGIEYGMLIGICAALFNFGFGYARLTVMKRVVKRSNVFRRTTEMEIIERFRKKIVVLELTGHIFFGSSVSILRAFKRYVEHPEDDDNDDESTHDPSPNKPGFGSPQTPYGWSNIDQWSTPTGQLNSRSGLLSLTKEPNKGEKTGLLMNKHTCAEFVILDFSGVSGVDATAINSCFMLIKCLCESLNIPLIYASIKPPLRRLMEHNEVLPDNKFIFNTCARALDYCERKLLHHHLQGSSSRQHSFLTLTDALIDVAGKRGNIGVVDDTYGSVIEHCDLNDSNHWLSEGLSGAVVYFERQKLEEGSVLWRPNELSTHVYILVQGEVAICDANLVQKRAETEKEDAGRGSPWYF